MKTIKLWTSPTIFSEIPIPDVSMGQIATRATAADIWSIGAMLPNPDEVLKAMGKDVQTYRSLLTDPRVGSNVENRQAGTLHEQWNIVQSEASSRVFAFIQELFAQLPVFDITSEMLEAPLYGYKPMEIMWQKEGSFIYPVSITGKPPEWFGFGQSNELRFKSRATLDGIDVSSGEYQYKFLLPRNKASYDNPYGFPVLSRAFWYTFFKRGGLKCFVTFVEKHGMQWVFGKYRQGASAKERDDLMDALENMIRDAVGIIPEGSSVEFPQASDRSQSAEVYRSLLEFCNDEATIAILGHTGTSQSTPGKLGSEDAALTVRGDIVTSDKRIVVSTWNQFIKWAVDINFTNEKYPVFVMEREQIGDKDLASRDSLIRRTGWKPTAQYFMDRYGMKEEWFTIDDGISGNKPGIPTFSEPVPSAAVRTAIEKYKSLDEFADSIPPSILQELAEGVLKPVLTSIEQCRSYEEILTITAEIFPEMKTRELENKIAQARFLAYMKGRLNG